MLAFLHFPYVAAWVCLRSFHSRPMASFLVEALTVPPQACSCGPLEAFSPLKFFSLSQPSSLSASPSVVGVGWKDPFEVVKMKNSENLHLVLSAVSSHFRNVIAYAPGQKFVYSLYMCVYMNIYILYIYDICASMYIAYICLSLACQEIFTAGKFSRLTWHDTFLYSWQGVAPDNRYYFWGIAS
jgi:hypothetical protein